MPSTTTSSPFSFPFVLMQPLLLALNHLLRQEPWAQETLRLFAGRVAHFDLTSMSMMLQVDATSLATAPASDAEPAVTIVVPLAAAAGGYATDEQAATFEYMRIEGEAEFVSVLSTLLHNLHWDATEGLLCVSDDVITQRVVNDAQAAYTEAICVSHLLTESVASYLTNEQPVLVRHARPAQFVADMAVLRDARTRLVRQLERLEKLP